MSVPELPVYLPEMHRIVNNQIIMFYHKHYKYKRLIIQEIIQIINLMIKYFLNTVRKAEILVISITLMVQ